MARKPKQAAMGTRKPRRADEIERKIERGEYEHDITLRGIYGDIAAADIIKMPKFKRENRALSGMIIVMLADAKRQPGLIGRTFAEMEIVDVSLGRFYDALHEVDPAEPDADEQLRQLISALNERLEQTGDGTRTRSDKGKKHKPRKYAKGWREQKDVAADFNEARFVPEKGAKPKGGCTLSKIKQWDSRYPDATHAHPHCGYHAMLRANPDLKSAYYEAVSAWRDYWAGWCVAFREWRKVHKASQITAFRYNPVKMVSGYSPDLIGTDADGNRYGTPDGKPKKRKS